MKKNYYPTANEYIAIPTITSDGVIEQLNYLSMVDRGVIELTGKPFLRPVIQVDGQPVPIDQAEWTWEAYWIPTFTIEHNGCKIRGQYITPQDTKGWFLRVAVEETEASQNENRQVEISLQGHFGPVLHSINETKPVVGQKMAYKSLWNQGYVFDFRTGVTKFAFGFVTPGGFDDQDWNPDTEAFCLTKRERLHKDQRALTVDLFMGIGLEEVSAVTQAIHMDRETGDHLVGSLMTWLQDRKIPVEDPHMEKILNVNQFFNYFYATGRTLDTEELILCTSRSPRYYVSAAYWDRDSLIWSFPALLQTEAQTAREALEYVFTRQAKNLGIHSRFIDGTVLEPGFEMDELCAPLLALDQYIQKTKDYSIVEEAYTRKALRLIERRMMEWKHPQIDLFGTFLMPTDDMRVYPYLTYNNVLVWKALHILSDLYNHLGSKEKSLWARDMAVKVKTSVWAHLTTEAGQAGQTGKEGYFVWSSDLDGNHDFYDEPPGSLTLLAYYGFVEEEDPTFVNTLKRLYTSSFPHYFNDTNFEELGCSHADHPWILSICNSLINGRHREALDMLRRTTMDNYIACESIDEMTGVWETGAHFATCAGFLVHALTTAKKEGHI